MNKNWWKKFWKLLWDQWIDLVLASIPFVLMVHAIKIFIELMWRIQLWK